MYEQKYLKYKEKYLNLKNKLAIQYGGTDFNRGDIVKYKEFDGEFVIMDKYTLTEEINAPIKYHISIKDIDGSDLKFIRTKKQEMNIAQQEGIE